VGDTVNDMVEDEMKRMQDQQLVEDEMKRMQDQQQPPGTPRAMVDQWGQLKIGKANSEIDQLTRRLAPDQQRAFPPTPPNGSTSTARSWGSAFWNKMSWSKGEDRDSNGKEQNGKVTRSHTITGTFQGDQLGASAKRLEDRKGVPGCRDVLPNRKKSGDAHDGVAVETHAGHVNQPTLSQVEVINVKNREKLARFYQKVDPPKERQVKSWPRTLGVSVSNFAQSCISVYFLYSLLSWLSSFFRSI
jgi:hypothetical protein